MIVEDGYLGYLKYEGDSVNDGLMDARDCANALTGFDEAYRYFIEQEKPSWGKEDLNLPVRIEKGCWQIMIPAGLAVFAGYYLKSTAEKAAQDGLFETGAVKDLNRILKAAINSMKWVLQLSKHVRAIGDTEKIKDPSILNSDQIGISNESGELLYVSKRTLDLYEKCPKTLFAKCTKIITDERVLEVGLLEHGEVVDSVIINPEDQYIFYTEPDSESTVVLPELEHGMQVHLEGEITRVTESTNTLGFLHKGHTLICKPAGGKRIAAYKPRIISQQEDHVFPKVRISGTVDRQDSRGEIKEKRPEIIFDDIQRQEPLPEPQLL